MFHGRGGALGRGGGPDGARDPRPSRPASVDGRFKVTEQGEVAFARYGDADIAWHHLEQLARAVAAAPGLDDARPCRRVRRRDRRRCAPRARPRGAPWSTHRASPGASPRATPIEQIALDADRLAPGLAHLQRRGPRRAPGDPVGVLVGTGAREPPGLVRARHRAARRSRTRPRRARSPSPDASDLAVLRGAPRERVESRSPRPTGRSPRATWHGPTSPSTLGAIFDEWDRTERMLLAVTGEERLLGERPGLRSARSTSAPPTSTRCRTCSSGSSTIRRPRAWSRRRSAGSPPGCRTPADLRRFLTAVQTGGLPPAATRALCSGPSSRPADRPGHDGKEDAMADLVTSLPALEPGDRLLCGPGPVQRAPRRARGDAAADERPPRPRLLGHPARPGRGAAGALATAAGSDDLSVLLGHLRDGGGPPEPDRARRHGLS